MKVTAALISMAIAMTSGVMAATSNSVTSTLALTSSTPSVSAAVPLTVGVTNNAQHSVFGYVKMTGGSAAAYSYAYNFNGTADTANVAVTASNGNVAQFAVGQLYCPACNSNMLVNGNNYNYVFTSLNASYGTASNTITYIAGAVTDANVQITAGGISLQAPAADTNTLQPGKMLYFVVPPNSNANGGNVTSATLTVTLTTSGVNPFVNAYVVGNGKCPINVASDGIARQSFSLTTLAGAHTIQNVTAGTYWVYFTPSATPNTLASGDTISLSVAAYNTTTCYADSNGFCAITTATSLAGTLPLSAAGTVSGPVPFAIPVTQTNPHSVFGYVKYTGLQAQAYNYSYNFNGTNDTANVAVAAANGTVAQYAVGLLECAVCDSNVTTTATYSYVFNSLNGTYISAANPIAYSANVIVDTNVALVNATALSMQVPAADVAKQQPGKFFTFTVPALAAGATTGNQTNGLLTLSAASNPFSAIYISGNGTCPRPPVTADSNKRVNFDISSNATLAGSYNVTNLTAGTFYIYLAPSTAGVLNSLGSSDTIEMIVSPYGNLSCEAGTSGFCAGAATLKSIVAVAATGLMAAAFMLF